MSYGLGSIFSGLASVGGWLAENPEAASLIGMVGAGVAEGYFNERAAKQARQESREDWERRQRKASNGGHNYAVNVTGGNAGLLAEAKYLK